MKFTEGILIFIKVVRCIENLYMISQLLEFSELIKYIENIFITAKTDGEYIGFARLVKFKDRYGFGSFRYDSSRYYTLLPSKYGIKVY